MAHVRFGQPLSTILRFRVFQGGPIQAILVSSKAVAASSNDTPMFSKFSIAFGMSQLNIHYCIYTNYLDLSLCNHFILNTSQTNRDLPAWRRAAFWVRSGRGADAAGRSFASERPVI